MRKDASENDRRLSKAWRNAGFAAVAIGVLVLGTQGVMSMTEAARQDAACAASDVCGD